MKRIIIVRHAKAVDPVAGIADFERSLKPIGIKEAHKISHKLIGLHIKPDVIITSPAFRALETSIIFAQELKYPIKKIKLKEFLYEEYTTSDFLEMINKLENEEETVMIFGHNPTVSLIASRMVDVFSNDMPPCSLVVMEFDVDKWKKVNIKKGRLAQYIYPESNK